MVVMVKESRGRLQDNIRFNSVFNTRIRVVVWTGENDTKTIRKRLVWTGIVLKTEQNSSVFI